MSELKENEQKDTPKTKTDQSQGAGGVHPRESQQFDINRNINIAVPQDSPVKPGMRVIIQCQGLVREVGPELCVIELVELMEQGRVSTPIYIYSPHKHIHPIQQQPKPPPPNKPY